MAPEEIKELCVDGVLNLTIKRSGPVRFRVNVSNREDVTLRHSAWLHGSDDRQFGVTFTTELEARGHIALFTKRIKRHGIEVVCND